MSELIQKLEEMRSRPEMGIRDTLTIVEAIQGLKQLTAERDQLAEKVASDAEDAEIGRLARLLRSTIEPSIHRLEGQLRTSIEIHGDGPNSQKSQLASLANQLLQALSQGGKA